jgi:excisionase family DNA binding protein
MEAGRRGVLAVFDDEAAAALAAGRGGAAMADQVERLLTIVDLSEMLGVPVDTLYGWRHRGQGYRVGRHVRYRRAHVEAWLESRLDPRSG